MDQCLGAEQCFFSSSEMHSFAVLSGRPIDVLIPGANDVNQTLAAIGQCAGKHIFLNVPCNTLVEILRTYVQHKQQAPENTSACVVVPEFLLRRREVSQLLTGVQLLQSFEQNASLPSSALEPYRPYPVVVFYDPIGLAPQLNAMSGTGLTFLFKGVALTGQAGHVPANICFDSGANGIFISQAFANRSGFTVKPCPSTQLTMANGESSSIAGTCDLHLKIQSYQNRVQGFVTTLAGPYDVILGDTWLNSHKAVLDYDARAIVIRKGANKISLTCGPPKSSPRSSRGTSKLLSLAQVKRSH
jgi:hypothetical protein